MGISKFFSFVFGIFGTALMLLTLMLSLSSLDGQVYMDKIPEEADVCAEKLMNALSDGDYVTAEGLLYGDTTLGAPREAASEEGKLVWRAFIDSFEYTFDGDCYGTGNGICRDVTITTLDITSISTSLPARTQIILNGKKADAQEVNNMNLVFEEDGSIRETVLNAAIETAIAQALVEDAKFVSTAVKLELVNENGAWQVVPSAQLLKAVSGGL